MDPDPASTHLFQLEAVTQFATLKLTVLPARDTCERRLRAHLKTAIHLTTSSKITPIIVLRPAAKATSHTRRSCAMASLKSICLMTAAPASDERKDAMTIFLDAKAHQWHTGARHTAKLQSPGACPSRSDQPGAPQAFPLHPTVWAHVLGKLVARTLLALAHSAVAACRRNKRLTF